MDADEVDNDEEMVEMEESKYDFVKISAECIVLYDKSFII